MNETSNSSDNYQQQDTMDVREEGWNPWPPLPGITQEQCQKNVVIRFASQVTIACARRRKKKMAYP